MAESGSQGTESEDLANTPPSSDPHLNVDQQKINTFAMNDKEVPVFQSTPDPVNPEHEPKSPVPRLSLIHI